MTSRGYSSNHDMARALARGLGWFSIALGVTELLASRPIKQGIGAPGPSAVFKAYGVREILTGVAILNSANPNQMVWGRVAGDVLDLVTLAPTMSPNNSKIGNATGAVAFVAAATLLDLAVASLDGRPSHASQRLLPPHRSAA